MLLSYRLRFEKHPFEPLNTDFLLRDLILHRSDFVLVQLVEHIWQASLLSCEIAWLHMGRNDMRIAYFEKNRLVNDFKKNIVHYNEITYWLQISLNSASGSPKIQNELTSTKFALRTTNNKVSNLLLIPFMSLNWQERQFSYLYLTCYHQIFIHE